MMKKINNLAMGIAIETDLDMLFQLKELRCASCRLVTSGHTGSMQGVGIVLGIAEPFALAPLRAPSGISTSFARHRIWG